MKVDEIRKTYLSFFEERGHRIVPSASLVPAVHDPSVLLTTAGMQPFKPYFLGQEEPPARRIADVQRCFRTTDIEEVGNTRRHLTFFEMLGNWSFGDYFKEESILGLGALDRGLRIRPGASMGDGVRGRRRARARSGRGGDRDLAPGGRPGRADRAASARGELLAGRTDWTVRSLLELYLDRGESFGKPGERPGDDTDRFVEYWNHVFMTYDLAEDGTLTELPMKNIDTGMGLERMAAVLQDVDSVFETDSLRPLVDLAEELSGRSYSDGGATTRAMRILADHSRGTAADRGRGRPLERGSRLRPAPDHAARDPAGALDRTGVAVHGALRRPRPRAAGAGLSELASERDTVIRWVSDEEESFGRTLERGTQMLADIIRHARRTAPPGSTPKTRSGSTTPTGSPTT